jgi:tetratricopeptide (TPR) repeat protein
MKVPGRVRRLAALQLGLAAVTVAVFWNVGAHGFLSYDDGLYVTANPVVAGGLTREGLLWAFTTTHAANWHPLTWLSHMLDVELFGLDPSGHHAMSVALHVANVLLLQAFLFRATGALWRSGAVAALFAWHPLHVESVAWVAERKDVLSTLFWMLTLLAYLAWCRRPSTGRQVRVAALFALGLMAKPMLVSLPLALLALDLWPLGRLEKGTLRRRLVEKAPLFALAALSCGITLAVQQSGGALASFERAGAGPRMANALVSYAAYLGRTVWPTGLSVLYPHPGAALSPALVAAAAAGLLAVSALAWRLRAQHPYVLAGWLWFLVTLLPVIGLVQVGEQGMADRYTYVPLVGIFWAGVWGASALLPERRGLLAVVATALLLASAVASARQVRVWRDDAALFSQALRATRSAWLPFPESPTLHFHLGLGLARRGRFDEAIRHYRRALALGYDPAPVHNNLGNALLQRGREEEALAHYERALAADPGHARARFNRSVARLALVESRVREERTADAVQLLEGWLGQTPGDAVLANALAWLLATSADDSLRDPERAVALAESALAAGPETASRLDTLAAALAAAGRYSDAAQVARRALALAESGGAPELTAALRSRLERYRAGRPYRGP